MKRGTGLFMLILVAGCGGGDGGATGGSGGGGGVATGQKRVFVTSSKFQAAAVKGICQTVAGAASLGGAWVEWLSYGSGVMHRNAIDGVAGAGPWVRLDGSVAFANHAQLALSPSVALSLDEHGQPIAAGGDDVWTGTLSGGVASDHDCDGWSASANASASVGGSEGRATVADEWTAWGAPLTCNNAAHVYCFEQ